MAESTDEISHALVWVTRKEEIEVVTVEELCDFSAPEDNNDFVRNKFVKINRGKLSSIEAILLALGSETEMNEASINTESSRITHALVNFLNREEIGVIPVENIQHFSENRPQHRFQFPEYTIYHGKKEDEDYETIYIHALGDNDEILTVFNQFKGNINYALVRFIDDDSLQALPIENIEKINPIDRSDFNQWQVYRGKQNTDGGYNNIQILRLGCFAECSSFIDAYNNITHALVVFKPNNRKEVIPIHYIQEFKKYPPDTARDFDKNKAYSGRRTSSARYSAVQIFDLGHEQILNFNKMNETKRMHLKKFNLSDLKKCNKTVSDKTSSTTDTEHDSGSETPQKRYEPPPKRYYKTKRKGKSNPSEERDPKHEQRKVILLNSKTNSLPSVMNASAHNFDDDHEVLNNRIADLEIANTSTPERTTRTSPQARNPLGSINKPPHNNLRANKSQKFDPRRKVIDDSSDEQNSRPHSVFNQKQRYRKQIRKMGELQRASRSTKRVCPEQMYKTDLQRFQILAQDSDSDVGTTEELSVFERFEVENQNYDEEPVKYIHLGWNVKILYSDWKKAKADSKDEYSFISNLADAMFGKEILQLFLQIKPIMKVADQKPRREVTKTEIKVIKQCLKYWIRAKCPRLVEERPMDIILNTTRSIFSDKIASEFKKYEQTKTGSVTYMKSTTFIRNSTNED